MSAPTPLARLGRWPRTADGQRYLVLIVVLPNRFDRVAVTHCCAPAPQPQRRDRRSGRRFVKRAPRSGNPGRAVATVTQRALSGVEIAMREPPTVVAGARRLRSCRRFPGRD